MISGQGFGMSNSNPGICPVAISAARFNSSRSLPARSCLALPAAPYGFSSGKEIVRVEAGTVGTLRTLLTSAATRSTRGRAARAIARPKIKLSALPNPIKALADSGVGAAATIEKIYAPEVMASGDQVFVKIKPVAGAKKYTVYVSAYPDGTGAQATPAKPDQDPSLLFVRGLQPAIPLYFFASYTDPDGKESKPSPARKTVLKDEFPFK